ncbi:hypothetical protein ACFVSN_17060 [Kitasatospora sp. NPDC057904]
MPGYTTMTVFAPNGRHASLVSNTMTVSGSKMLDVLSSALCD